MSFASKCIDRPFVKVWMVLRESANLGLSIGMRNLEITKLISWEATAIQKVSYVALKGLYKRGVGNNVRRSFLLLKFQVNLYSHTTLGVFKLRRNSFGVGIG